MKTVSYKLDQPADSGLERVIEPLASYISAASRPKSALQSALALLRSVVEETNRTASAHLNRVLENH
jgi:hypothetical protein